MYYDKFIILFTPIRYKKQAQKIEKTFLVLQYSMLTCTVVPATSLLLLCVLPDTLGLK